MKYVKLYTIEFEYNFKCLGEFDIIGKNFTFVKVKLITVSNNTFIPLYMYISNLFLEKVVSKWQEFVLNWSWLQGLSKNIHII